MKQIQTIERENNGCPWDSWCMGSWGSDGTGSCRWESWCGDFWRTDRADAFGWAALLLWAAAVMVAGSAGFADRFAWWEGWSVFFTGAGVIVLSGVIYRVLYPTRRRMLAPGIIFGAMLLGFGLDGLGAGGFVWPLALLVAAGSILFGIFARR